VQASFLSSAGLTARRILLASDTASLVLSFALAWRLLPWLHRILTGEAPVREPFATHAWLLVYIVPVWLLLGQRYGLYPRVPLGWERVVLRMVKVQALGLGALGILIFALKLQTVSRLITFSFAAFYLPVALVARAAVLGALAAHRAHIYNIPRILVIGTGERAREFLRRARRIEGAGYEIAGCLEPDETRAGGTVEGAPVLGTTQMFERYIFENPVDMVVLALPVECVPRAEEMVQAAMALGLGVVVLPDYGLERLGYALEHPEVSVEAFLGQPVAVLANVRPSPGYRASKRALDLVLSTCALLLLSPLLLLIAALVKLTSPGGPVLYRWNVVGTNLRAFTGYKFRTMVPNADALKGELLDRNEMDGPVFKMRNDPRVTPLGRVLRKFSLDELPQLFSVVKGDMSLVGPRPAFREEARRYEFWQRRKLSVKPGITCLWQVNGRNEIERFEDWARLDLEYVQKASLWLDCKILLKTVPAVLRGRGAY
jgi:exopolysaccharide biosynthesis polyprenyl glycosylphosphotransferase